MRNTLEKPATFEAWMRRVDQACWSLGGCSIHDLPDCCFVEWFEDCYTPTLAAKRAIREA